VTWQDKVPPVVKKRIFFKNAISFSLPFGIIDLPYYTIWKKVPSRGENRHPGFSRFFIPVRPKKVFFMMFRQYILLLCCLAGVLTVPRPALSDGASYGSLARRPRIVYHDGRALLTNPPAAGASAPFLQPYHREVAAIQASEKVPVRSFP